MIAPRTVKCKNTLTVALYSSLMSRSRSGSSNGSSTSSKRSETHATNRQNARTVSIRPKAPTAVHVVAGGTVDWTAADGTHDADHRGCVRVRLHRLRAQGATESVVGWPEWEDEPELEAPAEAYPDATADAIERPTNGLATYSRWFTDRPTGTGPFRPLRGRSVRVGSSQTLWSRSTGVSRWRPQHGDVVASDVRW